MIEIVYTQAEGYESISNDLLFTVQSFDEVSYTVEIKSPITKQNMSEVFDAIRDTIIGMDSTK